MLTDLLTSSRGPGVIGTILALIVLLGFSGLMVLVGIESPGSGLGAQIKEKKALITSLSGQSKHWEKAAVTYKENRVDVGQLEGVEANAKRHKVNILRLQEVVKVVQAKTAGLNQKIEGYKKQYRITERARAVGEEMAILKTKTGKIYERVKIKEISAIEMRFSHKNGNTGVNYKELPAELQDRFQFSEVDAAAANNVVKKRVASSVLGGERYRITKAMLNVKNKISQNNEYIGKWTTEIRRSESEVISNTSAIEAAEARATRYRSMPNRGLNWDNAKKSEAKADKLRRKSTSASSIIASRRTKISQAKREISTWQRESSQLQRELEKINKKK
jgi:hypothetical protein